MTRVFAPLLIALLSIAFACACGKSAAPAAAEPEMPSNRPAPVAKPAEGEAMPEPAPPPAPQPPLNPADADMEAFSISVMLELVDVMARNEKDCDRMAAELQVFFNYRGEDLKRVQAWANSRTPEQKKDWDTRNKAFTEELQKKLLPPMMACMKHAGVKQAMERLQ